MQLSTRLLADHAEAVNGKLYVVGGGWDRIYATAFPTTHAHMSVAGILVVDWNETNERHTLELHLRDADGNELVPARIQGQFELGRPPGMRPGDASNIPVVFIENNLQFQAPGSYAFEWVVDGHELGRLHFSVQPLEPATLTR